MGGKYEVRVEFDDEFVPYQTKYTNSFFEFIGIMFRHRKKLIYFTIRF